MSAPTENLVRSAFFERGTTITNDAAPKLHGYFSTFNEWYEVNSAREGRFLERIAPGAFTHTLVENRDRIKVLYDHGFDPTLGNKPLGKWTAGEDDRGAFYEVDLIDTDYNRNFVIPAADAGLLGSSFRFSIAEQGEKWHRPTRSADHNPHSLPERTITRTDTWEFGPCTFPANITVGSVGVRSSTDEWMDRLLHDSMFVARLSARMGGDRVEQLIASLPAIGSGETTQPNPEVSATGRAAVLTQEQRAAILRLTDQRIGK